MKILIAFGITILLLIFIFLYTSYTGREKKRKSSMIDNDAFLVDVRTPEEYVQGHVNGSVNIPLQKLEENINSFHGKKNIVVFCRSGKRSERAKDILTEYGFTNVVNGGTWKKIKKITG